MKRFSNHTQLARHTAKHTDMTIEEVFNKLEKKLNGDIKYTSHD